MLRFTSKREAKTCFTYQTYLFHLGEAIEDLLIGGFFPMWTAVVCLHQQFRCFCTPALVENKYLC